MTNTTRLTRLRSVASTIAIAAALAPLSVQADPQGGIIRAGSGTITQSGSQTTIGQNSERLIIDWQNFDIEVDESVRFNQPSTESIALNRVVGPAPTEISGALQANGNIWIVNQNGVTFNRSAQVDVGGLLATTADIDNDNFMRGEFNFDKPGSSDARVINHGDISFGHAGLAALVAPGVENHGVVAGRVGTVVLDGSEAFAVDFAGDGILAFEIESEASFVENLGTIRNGGGRIMISAQEASAIVDNTISLGGLIEAPSYDGLAGSIEVDGGEGLAVVSGSLSATGETAGEISIQSEHIWIEESAEIDVSSTVGDGGRALIGGMEIGGEDGVGAFSVHIEPGVQISANAGSIGDGGEVIIWSDQVTQFFGEITARGGLLNGDGGFAEVSGGLNLTFDGDVDLSAPFGEAGTLLLDPTNVQLVAAGAANDAALNADPMDMVNGAAGFVGETEGGAIDFTISIGAVQTSLQTNDVTIQATNNITQGAGAALDFSAVPGVFTLTLDAGNDVTLSQPVSIGDNPFVVNADNSINLNTTITGLANVSLTATGGTVNFGAGSAITLADSGVPNPNLTIATGLSVVLADLDIGGNLSVTSGGGVTDNGDGAATGDDIDVGGTTSLTVVNAIALDDLFNDFGGAVTANTTANATMAENVTLADVDGITLGAITAAEVSVTATDVEVPALITADAVTLTNAAGDEVGIGVAAEAVSSEATFEVVDSELANLSGAALTVRTEVATPSGDEEITLESVSFDNDLTLVASDDILFGTTAHVFGNNTLNAMAGGKVFQGAGGSITVGTGDIMLTAEEQILQDATASITGNAGGFISNTASVGLPGPNELNVISGRAASDFTYNDISQIALSNLTVGRNLMVTADGQIDDVIGGAVRVDGMTSLEAFDGTDYFDIRLDNQDLHDFDADAAAPNAVAEVDASGLSIELDDATGIALGEVRARDNLTVRAGGTISDTDMEAIAVNGTTSLIAQNSGGTDFFDIVLDNEDTHNFDADAATPDAVDAVFATGEGIVLDDVNALALGAITTNNDGTPDTTFAGDDGDLTVRAGGSLTDTANEVISVTGTTSLLAVNDDGTDFFDINLDNLDAPGAIGNPIHNFNAGALAGNRLNAEGEQIQILHRATGDNAVAGTIIARSTPADSAQIDTTLESASIYLTEVTADGEVLAAPDGDIFLANVDFDALSNISAPLVTLSFSNNLSLNGNVDTAFDLTTLEVLTFAAGSIDVNGVTTNIPTVALLTSDVVADVTAGSVGSVFTEEADITFDGANSFRNLRAVSGDDIEQAGGTFAVTGTTFFLSADTLVGSGDQQIAIDQTGNDFTGLVDAVSSGAITLRDTNNITLGYVSAGYGETNTAGSGRTLTVTSENGSIAQAGLPNRSIFVRGDGDGAGGTTLTGSDLDVVSVGENTLNGALVEVADGTSLSAPTGDILLGTAENDFDRLSAADPDAVDEVDATAAGDIVLSDRDAIALGTITAGGELTVTARGTISDTVGEAIMVNGTTSLLAQDGANYFDILLDNVDLHNFDANAVGPDAIDTIQATGEDIVLDDIDAIALGMITTNNDGSADASSGGIPLVTNAPTVLADNDGDLIVMAGGSIADTDGQLISVTGTSRFDAVNGALYDITLDNGGDGHAFDQGVTFLGSGAKIWDRDSLGIFDSFAGASADVRAFGGNLLIGETTVGANDGLLLGIATGTSISSITATDILADQIILGGAGSTTADAVAATGDVSVERFRRNTETPDANDLFRVSSLRSANLTDGAMQNGFLVRAPLQRFVGIDFSSAGNVSNTGTPPTLIQLDASRVDGNLTLAAEELRLGFLDVSGNLTLEATSGNVEKLPDSTIDFRRARNDNDFVVRVGRNNDTVTATIDAFENLIEVAGDTSLTAGTGNVLLPRAFDDTDQIHNDFQDSVNIDTPSGGVDTTLSGALEDGDDLILGDLNIENDFVIRFNGRNEGGNLTDAGSVASGTASGDAINVGGTLDLISGTSDPTDGDIILDDPANDLNDVRVIADDVTLHDADGFTLSAGDVGDQLNIGSLGQFQIGDVDLSDVLVENGASLYVTGQLLLDRFQVSSGFLVGQAGSSVTGTDVVVKGGPTSLTAGTSLSLTDYDLDAFDLLAGTSLTLTNGGGSGSGAANSITVFNGEFDSLSLFSSGTINVDALRVGTNFTLNGTDDIGLARTDVGDNLLAGSREGRVGLLSNFLGVPGGLVVDGPRSLDLGAETGSRLDDPSDLRVVDRTTAASDGRAGTSRHFDEMLEVAGATTLVAETGIDFAQTTLTDLPFAPAPEDDPDLAVGQGPFPNTLGNKFLGPLALQITNTLEADNPADIIIEAESPLELAGVRLPNGNIFVRANTSGNDLTGSSSITQTGAIEVLNGSATFITGPLDLPEAGSTPQAITDAEELALLSDIVLENADNHLFGEISVIGRDVSLQTGVDLDAVAARNQALIDAEEAASPIDTALVRSRTSGNLSIVSSVTLDDANGITPELGDVDLDALAIGGDLTLKGAGALTAADGTLDGVSFITDPGAVGENAVVEGDLEVVTTGQANISGFDVGANAVTRTVGTTLISSTTIAGDLASTTTGAGADVALESVTVTGATAVDSSDEISVTASQFTDSVVTRSVSSTAFDASLISAVVPELAISTTGAAGDISLSDTTISGLSTGSAATGLTTLSSARDIDVEGSVDIATILVMQADRNITQDPTGQLIARSEAVIQSSGTTNLIGSNNDFQDQIALVSGPGDSEISDTNGLTFGLDTGFAWTRQDVPAAATPGSTQLSSLIPITQTSPLMSGRTSGFMGGSWLVTADGDVVLDGVLDSATSFNSLAIETPGDIAFRDFIGDNQRIGDVNLRNAVDITIGETADGGSIIERFPDQDLFKARNLTLSNVSGQVAIPRTSVNQLFDLNLTYFGLDLAGTLDISAAPGIARLDLTGLIDPIRTRQAGLLPRTSVQSSNLLFNNCVIGDVTSCSTTFDPPGFQVLDTPELPIFASDLNVVQDIFVTFGNEDLWLSPPLFQFGDDFSEGNN